MSTGARKRLFSATGTGATTVTVSPARRVRTVAPRTTTLRGRVARGFTRRAGYYGRFSGPNAELKFFDTAISFTVDTTGEVPATGQLTLIPQGVTESTRVGRKCVVKSLQFRGIASFVPAAAAVASGAISIFVMQDKQTNGAAAAFTDVFDGTNANASLRNLANQSRFRMLKKIEMAFNSTAGATTAYNNVTRNIDFFLKCNIPLEFSSTTGAITELKSNNIFLLAGASGNIDDLVTISGNARVRFSDS